MHRRKPLRDLFFSDPEMSRPLNFNTPGYRRYARLFEALRQSPSSFNGQTTRCVIQELPEKTGRVNRSTAFLRVDFHAATISRFYAPVALGIWCANWERSCRVLGLQGKFKFSGKESRISAGVCGISWLSDSTAAELRHVL